MAWYDDIFASLLFLLIYQFNSVQYKESSNVLMAYISSRTRFETRSFHCDIRVTRRTSPVGEGHECPSSNLPLLRCSELLWQSSHNLKGCNTIQTFFRNIFQLLPTSRIILSIFGSVIPSDPTQIQHLTKLFQLHL
jgi:hypothetical protein